ncbi:Dot/Icm secretion system ATPase DotB (plasmid) [Vibrio nigripulchritudo]|uniref:type IV pilus twitching motility protein PilT n=1 Tax=Vibrio nigripulchritudo TaxID=28173 RepID=UPI00190E3D6E|nr:ATPase, T2SS/T4P/T4SS family [Vibrio nigripulchritudo]BCL74024.1 Dot/Icm secretion system ATPase DotB [Vibrio nigripulchritudo]BDU35401.1 Dot/Icm secretion system ATPase DotB [Vibrio nigripulchritudo]
MSDVDIFHVLNVSVQGPDTPSHQLQPQNTAAKTEDANSSQSSRTGESASETNYSSFPNPATKEDLLQVLDHKLQFEANDIDLILLGMCRAGGFTDLAISIGRRISRKRNLETQRFFNHKLTQSEVQSFVEKMYSNDAWIRVQTPGGEIDEAYEVFDEEKQLRWRFRVNICQTNPGQGTMLGVKIVFRQMPESVPTLSDLNAPDVIRKNCAPRRGLVMVGGETGSGKTTLCAAMIRHILETTNKWILGYESPIEFIFDGIGDESEIWQHGVGEYSQFKSYGAALKNALRCGPEGIFVGESRERETFMVLPKIAASGHFGLTTLHAKSIADMFPRIADEVDASYKDGLIRQIINYMHMAIVQYLVRTVDGGVSAVREHLIFTDEVKTFILESEKDLGIVRAINSAVEKFGCSLSESANELVDQGVISSNERDSLLGTIIE